ETRTRIDSRLEELVEHVPDRDQMKATALKYGGAAVGVIVSVGVIVVLTKSKLRTRRVSADAQTYAKRLLRSMPEVADAYLIKQANTPPPVPGKKDLKAIAKSEMLRHGLAEANARRLAAIEAGEHLNPPRGGVGTAVLTGLGVLGGVAAAQALGQKQR
ncbi:MAG: hypothetical protein ACI867_002480, partial [Glaciecola sp.]